MDELGTTHQRNAAVATLPYNESAESMGRAEFGDFKPKEAKDENGPTHSSNHTDNAAAALPPPPPATERKQHPLLYVSGNDDDDGDETLPKRNSSRRSGRACVSTTVQIDGHSVLRQNNYTVTGSTYEFHAPAVAPLVGHKKKAPPPNNDATTNDANDNHPPTKKLKPTIRARTVAQIARQHHNQAVQAATRPKQPLRWRFLAQHQQRLEPFCEPSVMRNVVLQHQLQPVTTQTQMTQQQPPVSTPRMIRATLRDYQLRGLEFMVTMHRQNLSMILGDEMGLGKTLQTISLFCYLKEQEHVTGPSLVICPLSVLSSWCHELQTWAPDLKYFRLHASNADEQARQKQELAEHATDYDVILTTYDMAKVPTLLHSLYQRVHFNYLVLDECQKIKGHLTLVAAAVRKIHAGNTLLLTGTPLQNNLVELWSLLNFMYPDIFTTMVPFQDHFDLSSTNTTKDSQHCGVIVDKPFLMKTQQLLELFMLRRLKTEVEKFLPDKLETKVYCPLSKTQTFWYKALLLKDVSHLDSMDNETAENKSMGAKQHKLLRSLFMQLRKCCNHPFLFDGSEADPDETSLQELVASSGKLSVLDMLLQALCRKGNRAVIFSQFTMVLDLLEDYCILRGWKFCRFDGSTDRAHRNYLIRRFNEPNSPYFLFLISTRSGGMGLNLQSADTCILFDSDWNPQSDIQAMSRVHRIGQTKKVHVYRLVSSGTVEERMLERAEKKLMLEMVNRESKDAAAVNPQDVARGLSAGELLDDIKFGCEAIFGNSGAHELPSWEDIDFITDRSRKDSDSAGKLKGGTIKSAQSFDAEATFSSTQLFGGADFQAIRKEQELKQKRETPKNLDGIAHLWKEIQTLNKQRDRKSRIVLVDGIGSGYGSASVPVLASNNYELLKGESSVFDRELTNSDKINFQVQKRKKAAEHDHQDHCQVCGEGGSLACCPQCPCAVHLKCVGLSNAKELYACTHHRCSMCSKNRASAGGLLFPCQSCAHSYCEDCLPDKGVVFLERVERFDKLGFDSTKRVVYIHCSSQCDNHAREELGFVSPPSSHDQPRARKEPLDLSHNFGALDDLEQAEAEVAANKQQESENALAEFMHTRGGSSVQRNPPKAKSKSPGTGTKKRMEKLCPTSGVVLERFETMTAAAKSVNSYGAMLTAHMQRRPTEPFGGYIFRFQQQPNPAAARIEKLCPTSGVVLERFETMTAAATSVNSYGAMLTPHMKKRPTEPFGGYIFRFLQQPNPAAAASIDAPGPLIMSMDTGGGKSVQRSPLKAKSQSPSTGTKKRMEKLCPTSGVVLERFETMTAAATSVNSYGAMLTLHMQKRPTEPFGGYIFRFQQQPNLAAAASIEAPGPLITSMDMGGGKSVQRSPPKAKSKSPGTGTTKRMEKLCPTSGVVLERFETMKAAATSVNSYGAMLTLHMQKRPTEPFGGYIFRFQQQPNPAAAAASIDAPGPLIMSMDTGGGKSVQRSPLKAKSKSPGTGTTKRMEKLCPTSGVVLERFETMKAAATSVNSYGAMLTLHMQKRPTEPFGGYIFRFQQQPNPATAASIDAPDPITSSS